MIDFISNLVGNDCLATVLMSVIPMIELKGGIVFAWDKLGFIYAFLLAFLGSTVVFFFLFWLLIPVINLLKKIKIFNKFACAVENYFKEKADETLKKRENGKSTRLNETGKKQLGVFIFVGIPLPLTGVWTGTAVAVFLGLSFKQAVLPIVFGNFVAGLLICLLSFICSLLQINLNIVLWILFIFALVGCVLVITKLVRKKA